MLIIYAGAVRWHTIATAGIAAADRTITVAAITAVAALTAAITARLCSCPSRERGRHVCHSRLSGH